MCSALSVFCLVGGLLIGASPLSRAQDHSFQNDSTDASLIELYSSEGCSSCPPAEAWIGKLNDSPQLWKQLFPVVFHVDYWDGLGWPDRFARAAYTERQRRYAAKLGQDSVYTPEFVVGGREWRGWFQGGRLPTAHKTSGTLMLHAQGGSISANYLPLTDTRGAAYTLHLVLLGTGIVSDVKAGENGGHELRHDFVVLGFQSQELKAAADGHFTGAPLSVSPTGPDQPSAAVAWVSSADDEVVQVAGGWLR